MKIEGEGRLVRIYLGEQDDWKGVPLHEAIVLRAHELGLAGATVLRGLMGYGAQGRLHAAKVVRLAEDLPVVVEIVDRADRIEAFLPELDAMVREGLVTVERVRIARYRADA